MESALGLATANAIANTAPSQGVTGDVLKSVELFPTDAVAMVGFFAPLVAELQDRVAELEIFEEQDRVVAASAALFRGGFCDTKVRRGTHNVDNHH